jgi:uncharacterized iron-regulated protein
MDHNNRLTRVAMRARFAHGLSILAAVMVTGTATPAHACAVPAAFDATLARCEAAAGHPLCGQIHATRKLSPPLPDSACANLQSAALVAAIDASVKANGVVILGEVHDNAAHHLLRAELLAPSRGTVFEQLKVDMQPAIDTFFAKAGETASVEEFKKAVDWDKSGWDRVAYDPLLTAAMGQGIFAGDVARSDLMKVAKQGLDALPVADRERMALTAPFDAQLEKASLAEIEEAHCGMLPKTALPGMAAAQRYRDAQLAEATLRVAAAKSSSFLITGNNHARTDRGVPWYLRTRQPNMPVLSVMFVEVQEGQNSVSDYVPKAPDGTPAADFIVLTAPPSKVRGDPCDAFKKKAPA